MSTRRPGAPFALRAVEPPESESLRKVKLGEMSLDEYLDERVEDALAHLKGRVSVETLESIRVVLREKLQYDPVLTEMVRLTTGSTPNPRQGLEGN